MALFTRSGRGERIVASSRAANRLGVTTGLALAEAKGMAPSCLFEVHDSAADREVLRQLAWDCQRWSPHVSLEESEPPACLHLDLTGCIHLLGSPENYQREIVRRFERYGFQVRVGMASTIGAAWAIAKKDGPGPGGKGLGPAERQDNAASLLPLSIEALRLSPAVLEKLRSVGITTIAELLRLPRASLPSRFGNELLTRLDQMFGRVPELMTPERPPEPVLATWAGEEPVQDRGAIEYVMRSLVENVVAQLTERQLATQRLLVRWHPMGTAPYEFSVNLLQPTASAADLSELIELQLEGIRIQEPIAAFRLEAVPTRPVVARCGSLFVSGIETSVERETAIAALVNRLSIKLGAKSVLRPVPRPDPQPERAVELVPYIEASDSLSAKRSDVSQSRDRVSPPRPLYFLPRPASVEVLALSPDGPPARFRWQRENHIVAHAWGPERIETGWWRECPVRRDYYRTETNTGRRFWLFRDRESARWFLQGVFT